MFFVLKGCVKQYFYDDSAEDRTVEFFTEGDFFAAAEDKGIPSSCFLSCVEDSVLITGNDKIESGLLDEFPELRELNFSMMEQKLGQTRKQFASFRVSSPEERYMSLLDARPDLLRRVPQYQIASYLGMTPESLSRIKKRLLDNGISPVE